MEVTVVHVRLPRELADGVDEAARGELRSRSNMLEVFALEGVERRAPGERERLEAG